MQICSVCSDQETKYRCPACKIKYCSLSCYKIHKETCAPVDEPSTAVTDVKDSVVTEPWSVDDLLHEDDITDKVPLQRLQQLAHSKELKDLLCNRHLRQLLLSVDSADSKDEAMKAAMQEPLFVEFSNQCLKIVENETEPSPYVDDDDDF
ncbi:zinc finger HIT domain-containing protein 3 [Neosynchiropus ocellatus]